MDETDKIIIATSLLLFGIYWQFSGIFHYLFKEMVSVYNSLININLF